jgi:hypothetical protein
MICSSAGMSIPSFATSPCDHFMPYSAISKILREWYIKNKEEVLALVNNMFSYKENFRNIPFDSLESEIPQWNNDYITPFDAIGLYGFVALKNPRYYVEVGSGNTTLFVNKAICDNNLRTKIISIDPLPRADINKLCHHTYRVALEDMDLGFFETLTNEDILLIDSSHRAFPNSDVTVFFTEVLPNLPSGLLYSLHDIYIPKDYPENWTVLQKRWYNEQYLLCAYLIGGAMGDKIVCPNAFLSEQPEFDTISRLLRGKGELFEGKAFEGSFFWIEKA